MTAVLTGRFLVEFARRPLNVALLVVVPLVFVTVSAGTLAEFAEILGGQAGTARIQGATAAWAAAFLSGVVGYFHVAGTRGPDRRLAEAGSATRAVVAARLVSALGLAALAVVAALLALLLRTDTTELGRAGVATAMAAVTYLGLGAVVGALVRSELNGSLVIIFIWMIDVFFGPAMGGTDAAITRLFPTHFPTLVLIDPGSEHAAPLSTWTAALIWTGGGLLVALLALLLTTRPTRLPRTAPPAGRRLRAGLRAAWQEYRRNTALWVLLVGLPVLFITLSMAVTPDDPAPVELREAGETSLTVLSMVDVHGAIMVPITVAFLAGLAGLFVAIGSSEADRRLVVAGFRTREVLGARLGIIALAAVVVSTVALAITAAGFQPRSWPAFALGTVTTALTYAMIGVVIGPLVGRLGGLYLMFLLPFLDVGLAQNVMFDAAPPAWAAWLPAHGAVRVLIDGAFTPGFDELGGLGLALLWLLLATGAAAAVFARLTAAHRM